MREDIDMIIDNIGFPYENMINKDIGIQRKTNEHIEWICGKCHTKLNSRNDMFNHLEKANHMVISDGHEDNHIDRPANKRGTRKFSRSDRKLKQLSFHTEAKFEEVGCIGDWLTSHGWEKDISANHWTIEVADALSVPTAPFGFVKSRVVNDSNTGHVVETSIPSLTTRPEQIHRNFKSARSVQVVTEVYEKSGEESIAWEDHEMLPDDQNRYRAVAARLNFLAVDRADLLHAAKE